MTTIQPDRSQPGLVFTAIDHAVETGEWTRQSLTELNNLINDINNGRLLFKRFPSQALRGFMQGGRANEAATLILRGQTGTIPPERRFLIRAKTERDCRQRPLQERIVENWARAAGYWIEQVSDVLHHQHNYASGGEAIVFANDGAMVTKLISLNYYITPQFALDRITLHNTLFPAIPITIQGFTRVEGDFFFVVEQPFIVGEYASQDEIKHYMAQLGFTRHNNIYTTSQIYVTDLHDGNVIKTPNGLLAVIDEDARLNTPDYDLEAHTLDERIVPANG